MFLHNIQVMTYLAITGWIIASIGLNNVNKWIFTQEDFPYPLFLTMLHMFSACLFGSLTLRYTPLGAAFGEGSARLQPPPNASFKIFVLSVVFTLGISLGNIALRHLYISFLKMVFALSPVVTVVMSRVFFDRPVDNYVYMSMVPLCFGSMMCITGEINFSIYGFLAACGATVLRGLKSILQGVLLKEQRIDSIRLLYHMSIPSSVMLLGASLFLEPSAFSPAELWSRGPRLGVLVLLSCTCAIGYNLMNFLVTFYTSPIALQVLGNISIILDVVISLIIFRNEVSLLGLAGIICVMTGTVMYQEAGSMKWYVDNRIARSLKAYF